MANFKFAPALSNLPQLYQGKTRDTFEILDPLELLIIATNRLSTHNVIHLSQIEYKDQVLTALPIFWMTQVLPKAGIPTHLVAYGIDIYKHLPGKRRDYPHDLHLRAIVVKKLSIFTIEFIFRAYLAGSLFDLFHKKKKQNPYGIILPSDLPLMWKFDKPIFTPTDKSETDDARDGLEVETLYPEATHLASKTFDLTRDYLRRRGIEQVDGKLEIGKDAEGKLYVADECATPDSSRFCNLVDVREGVIPPWRDKQKARDEAEKQWADGPKVALKFSQKVERELTDTYLALFEQITNLSLFDFQDTYLR